MSNTCNVSPKFRDVRQYASRCTVRHRQPQTLMPDTTPIKEEARRLIDELPEDATWSDFARLVVERLRVEEGIADLDAGITWTSDEIRNKLGIPK